MNLLNRKASFIIKTKTRAITILVLFALTSCTDFFADVNLQKEWKEMESETIIVHFRPEGFSSSPSPDEETVRSILDNQNLYYRVIQDSIGRSFNDKVLIYLYNKDESEKLIGTDGGGHAIPKLNSFYYTYLPNRREITDQYNIINPPIGAHELAHVITHRTLGYPPTKMMSEGYAVWLDGNYAGYAIDDIIRKYRKDEPQKIMTPDELLTETIDKESVYYPNAGLLIRYLVQTHGIEKINRLFTSKEDDFKEDFQRITGESWETMSSRFERYINNL